MNRRLTIGFFMVLALATGLAYGGQGQPRLTEIFVTDFVHVGDNQPVWNTSIQIKQGLISRSSYAAIEFVGVGVWAGTSSHLVVNGRRYVLPVSEPLSIRDIELRGKSVIPIPVGILNGGENSISIESGPINNPTNRFDDLYLANVSLVLSH